MFFGFIFSNQTVRSMANAVYKFSSPYWHIITGVFTLMFSALGFYIMICQLLDPKAISTGLLYTDIEYAEQLIRNPDIATPCLDSFQSTCAEQYMYAAFFAACSIYLAISGFRELCSKGETSAALSSTLKTIANRPSPKSKVHTDSSASE